MKIKGIARRWLINGFAAMAVALLACALILSFMFNIYTYDTIRQNLYTRSDELINVFSAYGDRTAGEFNTIARAYIEGFADKDHMEVLAVSRAGKLLVSSTGFDPDQDMNMPDYTLALDAADGYGYWAGEYAGERVMAISRVFRNSYGETIGGLRYTVSLEKAMHQTMTVTLYIILITLAVLVMLGISSFYFIYTIVTPVRQMNVMAQKIARGQFDMRIEKKSNDEVGQLCDTINEMAGELGATERMKNDFISSVSHELRTPLTAIQGWAETLQDGDVDEGTFRRGMGVIIHESGRLSGMVEELLDFSRMQNGRMVLNKEKIDCIAELADVVYMFTERAKAENKFLLYDEPDSMAIVMADGNRMRQVFVNILDNAIKYTDEGGNIRITVQQDETQVHVVISDNGCGISAEDLPNVKQKFYKANMKVRGSGIGLAMADEIVKLHGGTLDVESELGKGTAVTISLPLYVAPKEE